MPVKPLYKEAYDYTPELKLWMATNARLGVSETGSAMFGRIREIPFDAHIEGEVDTELPGKLRDAAPAILAWMVQGTRNWRELPLSNQPACMAEAQKEYRADQDSFQAFIDECCETDNKEALVTIKELLARYKTWQREELDAPDLNQKTLPTEAEQHGFKRGRQGGKRGIQGLRLKPQERSADEYDQIKW